MEMKSECQTYIVDVEMNINQVPILMHFNLAKLVTLQIDARCILIRCIFNQNDDFGIPRKVNYCLQYCDLLKEIYNM